jgi:hypothetical protein
VALTGLFSGGGKVAGMSFAAAAVVVGGSLLVLAAAWGRLRAPLVRQLPQAWQAKLPPV